MKMDRFQYFLMTSDLGRKIYLRGIVRRLKEISHLGVDKKILEIGCGNGIGTQMISEFFEPAELIATDLDEQLVKIAMNKNKGSNVVIEAGNAADLEFPDNEFDAVIGLSVIHHIPNWKDCVNELYRVIKPNGLLILKELSIETFESPFGRLARQFVSHPYDSMLRKDDFIEYLEQQGFTVITCQPHSMVIFMSDFLLVVRKDNLNIDKVT